LKDCFCLSFPQVLSGNPVSLMSSTTFLRMNYFMSSIESKMYA
jgi:hypothetical protein